MGSGGGDTKGDWGANASSLFVKKGPGRDIRTP